MILLAAAAPDICVLPLIGARTSTAFDPLPVAIFKAAIGTLRRGIQAGASNPATGARSGGCGGHVIDHIVRLACGGAGAPTICNGRRLPEARDSTRSGVVGIAVLPCAVHPARQQLRLDLIRFSVIWL
jgi:hypothetical protein